MIYTSLTIGPIYKTLKNAKKTREIWGASYFFSYLMKIIIKKIKKNYKNIEFRTPYVGDNDIVSGVGLYHDRLIVASENFLKKDLDEIIDEILKDIEKKSEKKISYSFLKNYLQIHTVELNEENIKNPILDISPYLDTAELNWNIQRESNNQILSFVKNNLNGSFLVNDAFRENKTSFESLPEIALSGIDKKLIREKLKDDELEIYNDPEIKKQINPYHKYIAIIQADGDNMGNVLKKIGEDKEKLTTFSKALFDFCIKATDEVKEFEGRMIFAGGDDLLFFAPVVSNKETIFHLCKKLSSLFEKSIEESIKDLKLSNKPSLSFGVSITYYKYPLYEARENASNLLFGKAKIGEKNAIAYKVTKHSGQSFESTIYKFNTCLYEKFLQIVEFNKDLDSNFLHSIYIKIDQYKTLLDHISKLDHKKEKLKNFFDNNFNEIEHEKYREFFDNLIEFIVLVYESYSQNQLNFIYSTLRFKKFLLGDKI